MRSRPPRLSLLGTLTLALAAPASAFAAPPTAKPKVKPLPGVKGPGKAASLKHRLAGKRPQLDNDSLLAFQLKAETPKKKGSIGAFGGKTVEVAKGISLTLPAIEAKAFTEHKSIAKTLKGLSGKAVFGSVRQSTEVYEFKDSFVLVRSTGATVSNPKLVKSKAPLFARLTDGKSHKVIQSKLTAESKKGFAAFKTEVAGYPAGHPLRKAMAKGDQALLDALASGVGDVEIVDTLHIPKRAPKTTSAGLQIPKVIGGRLDYSKKKSLRGTKPSKSLPGAKPGRSQFTIKDDQAAAALGSTLADAAAGASDGGGFHETAEFMAGNTWAESWTWQRRWNVPSGFLRVTLGASYGFGLRIPIEVKTKMSPAWVCDDGVDYERRNRSFKLDVKAEAKDGDVAFYRRAQMPEDKILNGDELALQASVGYGIKLRLLWKTLVNRPYKELGVDWGSDFDPPQGSATQRVTDIFLPASATHTAFSIGPLSGSARLGFRVDVSGKVHTRVTARQGSTSVPVLQRPSSSTGASGPATSMPQVLTLANAGWKKYTFRLRNGTRNGGAPVPNYNQQFGFRIDQVGYDSSWSVVPGVKVNANASYAGYGVHGTWTFWLDSARVPIGSIDLGHHPGTRRKHQNFGGRKIWHLDTPGDTRWCADNNPAV